MNYDVNRVTFKTPMQVNSEITSKNILEGSHITANNEVLKIT